MKFYTLFFCSLVGFAPLSYGWWGYTLDCTEKKGKKDSWDEAKNSTCVNDEDQFEDNPNWRRAFVKKNCPDDINDPVYKADPKRKAVCLKGFKIEYKDYDKHNAIKIKQLEKNPILCTKEKGQSENWEKLQNSFCMNDDELINKSFNFRWNFRVKNCPDDINNPAYKDSILKDKCLKSYQLSSYSKQTAHGALAEMASMGATKLFGVGEMLEETVETACTKEKAKQSWDQVKNSFCMQDEKNFRGKSDFREAVRQHHCPNDIDDPAYQDPYKKKLCKKMQELSDSTSEGWDGDCSAERGKTEPYEEAIKSPCVKNPMYFIFNPNWRDKFTEKNCPNNINDSVYATDPKRKEICEKAYDYLNRQIGSNWRSSVTAGISKNWSWTCNQGLGNEPIEEIIATGCLNPDVAKGNPNFLTDFKQHHCGNPETLAHLDPVVREIVQGACATPIVGNIGSLGVTVGQEVAKVGTKMTISSLVPGGAVAVAIADGTGATRLVVDKSEDGFNEIFGSEYDVNSDEYKKQLADHQARQKDIQDNKGNTFGGQKQENDDDLWAFDQEAAPSISQDALDKQVNLIKSDQKDELGNGACTSGLGEEPIENIIVNTTCLKPTKRKDNPLFLESFKKNHCGNPQSLNHANALVKQLLNDSCSDTVEHTVESRLKQASLATFQSVKNIGMEYIPAGGLVQEALKEGAIEAVEQGSNYGYENFA